MRSSGLQAIGTASAIAADIYSSAVSINQDYGYAVQAVWTGAGLQGTCSLQATVDGSTWSDIPSTSATVNGAGSFLWNVTGAFYLKFRVKFAYSAGPGTIAFYSNTKGP